MLLRAILPAIQHMYTSKGGGFVDKEELLSASDIAREAEVHRSTVGGWLKTGKIQPVQTRAAGSRTNRLYRREDVQLLIDNATKKRAAVSDVPSGAATV